jgi:hypothetical protein
MISGFITFTSNRSPTSKGGGPPAEPHDLRLHYLHQQSLPHLQRRWATRPRGGPPAGHIGVAASATPCYAPCMGSNASTQNQALSALPFLYRHVIGREVGDLGEGWGRVLLPDTLDRKYPNAPKEWRWQWVFPQFMDVVGHGGPFSVRRPRGVKQPDRETGRAAQVFRAAELRARCPPKPLHSANDETGVATLMVQPGHRMIQLNGSSVWYTSTGR